MEKIVIPIMGRLGSRNCHRDQEPWPWPKPWHFLSSEVELLAEFDVASPDVADILAAIDLHRLHGFSFWDALVLRAAKQAGCSVVLTEDMQDARKIEGLQIVNPFP